MIFIPESTVTKSDIIRTVHHSKSAEMLTFSLTDSMADRTRALKILNDAVQNNSTVIILK